MAKLGWVSCGLVVMLVVGVAAARPATDDSAKLDEIKALLVESNRLQRIDVHRRVHKHPLFKDCDFAERCQGYDGRAETHAFFSELSSNKDWRHPFSEGCGTLEGCKKAEQDWREVVQKRRAALEKK